MTMAKSDLRRRRKKRTHVFLFFRIFFATKMAEIA